MIPTALSLLHALRNGHGSALSPPADGIAAIAETAPALHERIAFLRCRARTPKADRPALLAYLERRIAALEVLCDVRDGDGAPCGWIDPADPFLSGCQWVALRRDFEELVHGPYPLGDLSADPFAAGRLFNGKKISAPLGGRGKKR